MAILVSSEFLLLLVFSYNWHVLHHLLVARNHHIVVLALWVTLGLSLFLGGLLALLEQSHIQLQSSVDAFKTYLILGILINVPEILGDTILRS